MANGRRYLSAATRLRKRIQKMAPAGLKYNQLYRHLSSESQDSLLMHSSCAEPPLTRAAQCIWFL
jgi:hypothetical protein